MLKDNDGARQSFLRGDFAFCVARRGSHILAAKFVNFARSQLGASRRFRWRGGRGVRQNDMGFAFGRI
jgi:hypothetical protein